MCVCVCVCVRIVSFNEAVIDTLPLEIFTLKLKDNSKRDLKEGVGWINQIQANYIGEFL